MCWALQATNLGTGHTYLCDPRWETIEEADSSLLCKVLAGHAFGLTPDYAKAKRESDTAWRYDLIEMLDV